MDMQKEFVETLKAETEVFQSNLAEQEVALAAQRQEFELAKGRFESQVANLRPMHHIYSFALNPDNFTPTAFIPYSIGVYDKFPLLKYELEEEK